MAFEIDNFEQDVLERSRTAPVLVDFWAPWCGPCRVLSPTLERLAEQSDDQWTLAKVNIDHHPDLSRTYGIRGIPAVKLFVDGTVADEFTGALPEYAVRQWLEKAIPSENKKRVGRAESEIAAGNLAEARKLLEAVLAEEPEDAKARILLAQLIVFDEPERAGQLVSGGAFAGPGFVQVEEAVRTVARLHQVAESELPDGEGKSAYVEAISSLRGKDFDTALDRFIEVIRVGRDYDDDGARKACVAIFTLLGEGHPTVRQYRRIFDMTLY